MSEIRRTLVDVASGKIELVLLAGKLPVLQFNCTCIDALPFCMAACCRMRSGVNAVLTQEEYQRLECHLSATGEAVLDGKPEDDSCVYLDSQSHLCKIQESKPKACSEWHCSPNGLSANGNAIMKKDMGWFLSPIGALTRISV